MEDVQKVIEEYDSLDLPTYPSDDSNTEEDGNDGSD